MLGKLEKVDIREIWKNEASDFTTWLAKEENLKLLGEEIGISIKLIKTEANVGAFAADILAEEEESGHKIIIENQLEETDHDHLGKLLTYGSGYDATTLIWISKHIREEHQQAINWLNNKSDKTLNIFAIKIEAWKIGDSLPAPKFQVICSPNDWAKVVKRSSDESALSETNIQQFDFWTEFSSYLEKNSKKLKPRKPRPQHWYDLSIGNSQLHIALIVSFQSDFLRCDIYIPNSKEMFHKLYSKRTEIEKELGLSLIWEELTDAKASRIKFQRDDVDLSNRENYKEYFRWFVEIAEKYYAVLPRWY